jgi:zinc transporter ZupT
MPKGIIPSSEASLTTITPITIFFAALITALATGLGTIPFFFARTISDKWLSISNAIAAGLMLGASHSLISEGINNHNVRTLLGILLGLVFMLLMHGWLHRRKDELHIGEMEGANAIKALMIMGVMTLHSFAEGVGVGVSFGGGNALGNLITTAIAVHNIPEGLAISVILVPRGVKPWRAGLLGILSSLPQPLMAVPAFIFVTLFTPLLPIGLGFAAGAMIWMVFSELIPETMESLEHSTSALIITLAFTAMVAFQELILAN